MTCKWKSDTCENICCENKADESGYCIFHKHNKNNEEKKAFIDKIKKDKISNFRGFVFEDKFNINEIIDYEYDELKFIEIKFLKEAIFSNYEFNGNVYFENIYFEEKVYFEEAIFNKNCVFYKVVFNKKYINEKNI
ncbi:hypothetical protein [[Clostridium] dakarense]|uniref:hypothetical protein n=1 Tax=Faecalimicrobium dakarense TaxID=1301100 RepID=UPI0004ADBE6C|nr:hypothetical protein [[Clostridium] dakarense]